MLHIFYNYILEMILGNHPCFLLIVYVFSIKILFGQFLSIIPFVFCNYSTFLLVQF